MTETVQSYDIPIRIDKNLVDVALLAESLIRRMKHTELQRFRNNLEKPTICKGDAKSTTALLASIGLMFVSAIEEARKAQAARDAASEPMNKT